MFWEWGNLSYTLKSMYIHPNIASMIPESHNVWGSILGWHHLDGSNNVEHRRAEIAARYHQKIILPHEFQAV